MRIASNAGTVWVGLWLAACGADTAKDNNPTESKEQTTTAQLSLFPGSGTSGAGEPLAAEIPPDTARECVPQGVSDGSDASDLITTCYFDEADTSTLAAFVERRLEVINDTNWVHIRLTFNPDFVDNTYGANAIGWGDGEAAAEPEPMAAPEAMPGDPAAEPPKPGAKAGGEPKPKPGKGGHTFKDLLGSDHAEFKLFTKSGDLSMHFKLDYISEGADTASGYGSLGVEGGDGKLIVGEPEWILGATSSLDRNLNGCDYASYTTDSPETDADYTPNADAPEWDYRVVYEVWVAEEALGGDSLDDVTIEYVHASPSKTENTLNVEEGPCPPPTEPPSTPPPSTVLPPSDPPEVSEDAGAPPSDSNDAGPSGPFTLVR